MYQKTWSSIYSQENMFRNYLFGVGLVGVFPARQISNLRKLYLAWAPPPFYLQAKFKFDNLIFGGGMNWWWWRWWWWWWSSSASSSTSWSRFGLWALVLLPTSQISFWQCHISPGHCLFFPCTPNLWFGNFIFGWRHFLKLLAKFKIWNIITWLYWWPISDRWASNWMR